MARSRLALVLIAWVLLGNSMGSTRQNLAVIGDSNAAGIRNAIYGDGQGSTTGILTCWTEQGVSEGSRTVSWMDDRAADYIADDFIPNIVVLEAYGADLLAACLGNCSVTTGTSCNADSVCPASETCTGMSLSGAEETSIANAVQSVIDDLEAKGTRTIFARGIGSRFELCSQFDTGCTTYATCVDGGYGSVSSTLAHSDTLDLSLPRGNGTCSITTTTSCVNTAACPAGACSITTGTGCQFDADCPATETCVGEEICVHDSWATVDTIHASFQGYDTAAQVLVDELDSVYTNVPTCP